MIKFRIFNTNIDDDLRTREQYYFEYLNRVKAESEEEEPTKTQYSKHSEEDYNKLKEFDMSDVMKHYDEGDQKEIEEYNEFFDSVDMVQILQKTKSKEEMTTELLKAKIDEVKKKSDFAAELIDQSKKYKQMDEREEKIKAIEEVKKMQKVALQKDPITKPEGVLDLLNSYTGKYAIRDVKEKDKNKLRDLRKLAKSDFYEEVETKKEEKQEPKEETKDSES